MRKTNKKGAENLSEETRAMINELVQMTTMELMKEIREGNMPQSNAIILLKDIIGYTTPKLSANLAKYEGVNTLGKTQSALDGLIQEAEDLD